MKLQLRGWLVQSRCLFPQVYCVLTLILVATAQAQGPAPETAPPLFPKGALLSYGSEFFERSGDDIRLSATSYPTLSHQGNFVFTWGFYPNFDLTITAPIVTNRFDNSGTDDIQGTGIGDTLVLLKYRFYRRDSQRGTTQASFTGGPKVPSGKTDLKNPNGDLLPATLQPGSGSTDFFLALNWTYTGLFHIKRLVADEDFHCLIRTVGTQQTRIGSDAESRFWLSYRPYESRNVKREWFIGPTITWLNSREDEIQGVNQGNGGDVLLAGVTTYVGVSPGMHVWLGLDWAVAHSGGTNFMPIRRHISFGITRQFRFL